MTTKIRAYRNWEEEATDSISEWAWMQVAKAIVVGVVISVPMFGFGALTAQTGVNRWEAGLNSTGAGHEFLWTYAAGGAQNTIDFVQGARDNGSSETN